MTQEDIEKMLNDQVNAVKETIDINAPGADVPAEGAAPVETAAPIEDAAPAEDVTPAEDTTPAKDVLPAEEAAQTSEPDNSGDGGKLSPEEIEALLGDMQKDAQT